jgi:hypothetical protein
MLQVSVEFLFPRWLRMPRHAWIEPLGCVFAELAQLLGKGSYVNPTAFQDLKRISGRGSSP